MYCATTGTFLQRDPLGQPGHPVLGYSHEAVTQIMAERMRIKQTASQKMSRSSDGRQQFANGLNLYEYANSNPLRFTDPFGLSVTIITNTDSVGGAGHQGTIVGNDDIGYTYFSYGGHNSSGSGSGWSPSSSGGGLDRRDFSTWDQAMDYAKSIGYDNYYGWDTTAQQDIAAKNEAKKWKDYTYNLFYRNCGDNALATAKAAGKNPGKHWMPTYTDKANQGKTDFSGTIGDSASRTSRPKE